MNTFDLDPQYQYKLESMVRGAGSRAITNSCNVPWRTVTVDYRGNCMICNCDGWLPIPVGQVLDFQNLDEVWNSQRAKIIQKDIEDKKYTWCAIDYCGIKQQNLFQHSAALWINIDDSCNLHCPSCRRDPIMVSSGPEFDFRVRCLERILIWLDQFDQPISITLSGNGDPLASHIIRPLFKSYQPRLHQRFVVMTNGLLIKKQLGSSPLLPNVKDFVISVDAGSDTVYTQVRRGGSWAILLENFEWLKDNGFSSRVTLKFALQKNNYRDLPNFSDICERFGFRGIVHQLDDWGTWIPGPVPNPDHWTIKNGCFIDHDVLNKQHPCYQDCQTIVENLRGSRIKFEPVVLERLS